jgi:putative FmdB family regulatory protein
MPTYEYECQKCGHFFEVFQSIKDEPLKRCPNCRGKLKRVVGAGANIIFKGSGFYQTDYRSENYKKGQKAEKSASEAPKPDSKSDKPAGGGTAKPDSKSEKPAGRSPTKSE